MAFLPEKFSSENFVITDWLMLARVTNTSHEEFETIEKIPIFMWCIFGVLQLTPLHSID